MWIELDDEVWDLLKKSWFIWGVKTDEEIIKMLNQRIWEDAYIAVNDAKRHLISEEPEALMTREIGIMEEILEQYDKKKDVST